MPPRSRWLPPPLPGTDACGGFDGSLNDDWTVIRLETRAGFQFTPRYGPNKRPTIWNPAEWPNHRIPRGEVKSAWSEIARTYRLLRVYCDPGFHDETDWVSDIETWDQDHGPDVFVEWPTNQIRRMYPALRRVESDLENRTMTHDGCPITETHIGNAMKLMKGDAYFLGKPSQSQKIDAGVTSVICHEAACDMRAAGWPEPELPSLVFSM